LNIYDCNSDLKYCVKIRVFCLFV